MAYREDNVTPSPIIKEFYALCAQSGVSDPIIEYVFDNDFDEVPAILGSGGDYTLDFVAGPFEPENTYVQVSLAPGSAAVSISGAFSDSDVISVQAKNGSNVLVDLDGAFYIYIRLKL